eukprot:scaffold7447_cov353-Pinguiococcus_pyrenoidosus.AAC.2
MAYTATEPNDLALLVDTQIADRRGSEVTMSIRPLCARQGHQQSSAKQEERSIEAQNTHSP